MELSQIGLMCEPITPPYAESISPDRSSLVAIDKDPNVLKENVYNYLPQTECSSSFFRASSLGGSYESSVSLSNCNVLMANDFEQSQYKSDETDVNLSDLQLASQQGLYQNVMLENNIECHAEASNLNDAKLLNVIENDSGMDLCKEGDFADCLQFSSHEPQASYSCELQPEVQNSSEDDQSTNFIDYSIYFNDKTEVQSSSEFQEAPKSSAIDYGSYFTNETDAKENVCKSKDCHYAQDYENHSHRTDHFRPHKIDDTYNEMRGERRGPMSHYSRARRGTHGFRGSFVDRRPDVCKTRDMKEFPNTDSIDKALLTGERILFSSQGKNKPFSDLREVIDVYRHRSQSSNSRKLCHSSEPHYKDDPYIETDQYYHKYRQHTKDRESEDSHYSSGSFEPSYSRRGSLCKSSYDRLAQKNRNYFENKYSNNSQHDFEDQSSRVDIAPNNILISVKHSSHPMKDYIQEMHKKNDQRRVMISDRMRRNEYSSGRSFGSVCRSGDHNWEGMEDNWEGDNNIYDKLVNAHHHHDHHLEEFDAHHLADKSHISEAGYIMDERRVIFQAKELPEVSEDYKNMEDKSLLELEERRRSLMEAFYHAFSPIRNILDEDLHDKKSKRLGSSSNSSIRSKKRKHGSEEENEKSKKKKHKKHHKNKKDKNNDNSENKNIDCNLLSMVESEFPNSVPTISISDENFEVQELKDSFPCASEVKENLNVINPITEVWDVNEGDEDDDDYEQICRETIAHEMSNVDDEACKESFHDNWDGLSDNDADHSFDEQKHLSKSQKEFDKPEIRGDAVEVCKEYAGDVVEVCKEYTGDVVEVCKEYAGDEASHVSKVDDADNIRDIHQNGKPEILHISSEIEDDDKRMENLECDDMSLISFRVNQSDHCDRMVVPKDKCVDLNDEVDPSDDDVCRANICDDVIEVDSDVDCRNVAIGVMKFSKGNNYFSSENFEEEDDDKCLVEGESGEETLLKLNKSEETEEESSDDQIQNQMRVLNDEENFCLLRSSNEGLLSGAKAHTDRDKNDEINPVDIHFNKNKNSGDEELFCYSPTENDRFLKSLQEDVHLEEKHKRFLQDMNLGACDLGHIPGLSPTVSDSPQGAYSPSSQPPSAIEETSPMSPASPPQCATPQSNAGVPDMMQFFMQTLNNQASLNNKMNLFGNIVASGGDVLHQLLAKVQSAYKTPIGQPSANQNGLMAFSTNPLLSLPFLIQSQKSVSPAILHYLSLQNLSTLNRSSICDLDTLAKNNETTKISYSPFDINTISPRSEDAMSFSPPSNLAGGQGNHGEGQSCEKDSTNRNRVKASNKNDLQRKLVYDIKELLRPVYKKGKITKEDYKDILRKTVPKIVNTNKLSYNRDKVTKFAEAYIQKVIATKKYYSKKGANPT